MVLDEVLTITHTQSADDSIQLRVASHDQPNLDLQLKSQYSSPSLQAFYADFSLVSPFVQRLLQRRPAELRIDYLCTETADLASLCAEPRYQSGRYGRVRGSHSRGF